MSSPEIQETLDPGTVHVWCCFTDRVNDPVLLARYASLLSDEERRRWRRYAFDRDRHRHLVSWALVRTSLSRYAPVDPAAWRFCRGAHGKPSVQPPPGSDDLRFNLSHTEGLAVCAVAQGDDVGVDVERTERDLATVDVAERSFSADEFRAWKKRRARDRRTAFFTYWTLKEAFIKAEGSGISYGLQSFGFDLTADPPTIRLADNRAGSAGDWCFRLFEPDAAYAGAIALRRGSPGRLTVDVREVVPLQGR